MNRRQFVQTMGTGIVGGLFSCPAAASDKQGPTGADNVGMLLDTTECIGCRKCEWACNRQHGLTDNPLEVYEDVSVFEKPRRMTADAYTVVNRYPNPENPERPIYVKVQCMHCLNPACVSACIVGALTQQETGEVTYDAWKCLGCRYCMVACPFQVPAYEYANALTPRVRKCTLCFELAADREKTVSSPPGAEMWVKSDIYETAPERVPACARMCPVQAMTFGNRADLVTLAHEKIEAAPERYFDHVYGEHEVGGTAWLYLASQPLEELGLLSLGTDPIPPLTESIQHSIFRYGIPPALVFGILGAAMWVFNEPEQEAATDRTPREKEGGA